MKKIPCLLILTMCMSIIVSAGSVPEEMLVEDSAQIFFGKVEKYSPEDNLQSISVTPIKKVKGEIKTGQKQIFQNPSPVGTNVYEGSVYLFAYLNEANPVHIFDVTSYDTKTLKLKNIEGDMWRQFEKLLNDGEYELAEKKRLKETKTPETITLTEFLGANKDAVEEVTFKVNENGMFEEKINCEKFFELADRIILKQTQFPKGKEPNFNGLYIELSGKVELENSFAFISTDKEVDRYGMFMSRLPAGAYTMSDEDIESLYSLISCGKLKMFYAKYGIYIYIGAVLLMLFAIVIFKKKKDDVTKM